MDTNCLQLPALRSSQCLKVDKKIVAEARYFNVDTQIQEKMDIFLYHLNI